MMTLIELEFINKLNEQRNLKSFKNTHIIKYWVKDTSDCGSYLAFYKWLDKFTSGSFSIDWNKIGFEKEEDATIFIMRFGV